MRSAPPPFLARFLARLLVRKSAREFVLGDLEELYTARREQEGVAVASRRYWGDVLSLLRVRLRRAPRGHGPVGAVPTRPSLRRDLRADLSASLRGIRRHPGFHALAVLTLALGVGSTAAVFGMANQLFLRPLPGTTAAEEAAYLQFRRISEPESVQGRGISLPDLQELRRSTTLMTGVGSYGRSQLHVGRGEGRPISVTAGTVYGDFFEVLGVRPSAGRLIRVEETEPGGNARIVVLSEALRATLFGREEAVGQTLLVNGEPVEVVGVAGGGFTGPERGSDFDMWIPHPALVPLQGFPPDRLMSRQSVMHNDLVARLRKGASAEAAETQIAGILRHLGEANPESREWLADLRPVLFPGLHIRPMMRDRTYASLRLMAGIVALVLLIACANVANLLLFRNVSRRGAVATRRALGASAGRITRQHMVESLIVAAMGAVAGLGVAWLVVLPFRGESLAGMPAFEPFTVDWRVAGFAAAAAVVTAALFGAAPSALAGRFDLDAALREAGARDTRRLAGIRWFMSAAQIGLSLTLLVGALLLTRTVRNLYGVDTGFSIEKVAVVPLPSTAGGGRLPPDLLERDLLPAVTGLPSVEEAALDWYGPHGSRFNGPVALPGTPRSEAEMAAGWPVTTRWFELLDVELIHGRTFRDAGVEAPPAREVILTSSLARRLFGRTDVVGRSVQAGIFSFEEMEVVGVTEDVRSAFTLDQHQDAFFLPFTAAPPLVATLLVRTREFNAGVAREIERAVEAVLPDRPVPEAALLEERLSRIHSERRVFTRLLGILSALAVLLAAVGLYGVIAFAVAGRVREFGIRLALGAEAARIVGLVLRQAGGIVAAGTLAGLLGAYGLSALLENRLFGVPRLDPASYALAALLFGVVAALACWTPARAAMRVDPVETLRVE